MQRLHIRQLLSQQHGAWHMSLVLSLGQPGNCLGAFLLMYRCKTGLPKVPGHLTSPLFPVLRNEYGRSCRKMQGRRLLWRRCHGKMHRKAAARPFLTFHQDLSVHPFHQIFDNRHAQSGSFYLTGGLAVHTLKGDKDLLQKFRTHADSIILTAKIQPYHSRLHTACRFRRRLDVFRLLFFRRIRLRVALCKPHRYLPAILGIFHRISDNIDQNLSQMQRISDNIFLLNPADLYFKLLILLCRLRPDNNGDIMNQIRKRKRLLIQCQTVTVNA